MNAEEILLLYARRRGIESLFHNLKRWWGMNNLWQQKHIVLELWMQIRSMVATRDIGPFEAAGLNIINPWKVRSVEV
jgi:hypothetical protein